MAIALRSGTSVANASRTNTTVSAPAGAVNGSDYITVAINAGQSSNLSITPPSGWSLIGETTYSNSDPWYVHIALYGRVHDGASSWTFTHATGFSQARAIAWTGVDLTTPVDVTAATAQQIGSTPVTCAAPTINIATVGARGIIARGSWDGNAITPPTNWTEDYDAPVMWVGHRDWAATGATGSITVGSGNGGAGSPWGIIHAALRPAGGAGPTVRTATGTLTLGGTNTQGILFSRTATGNLALSGSTAQLSIGTRTASGTLILSGTAPTSGGTLTRTAEAALTLSGAAPRTIVHSVTAAGSMNLGGTAEISGGTLTRAATGTLTLSGEALTNASQERTATATLSLGGTVEAVQILSDATTGSLTLGGTAEHVMVYSRTAEGTLNLSGTAPTSGGTLTRTSQGTLTISGIGNVMSDFQVRTATGTLELTGAAPAVLQQSRTALGTVVLTGASTELQSYTLTATGTLTLDGTAEYVITEIATRTALGTLVLTGTARVGNPPPIPQQRRISGSVTRSIKGPKVRSILSVTPKVG